MGGPVRRKACAIGFSIVNFQSFSLVSPGAVLHHFHMTKRSIAHSSMSRRRFLAVTGAAGGMGRLPGGRFLQHR
jgi:hypothetical protein